MLKMNKLLACTFVLLLTSSSVFGMGKYHFFNSSENGQTTAQSPVYSKIRALKNAGRLQDAKALALQHLQQNPNDFDVMLMLGIINYQEGNIREANNLASHIIQQKPKYEDARILLIRTYIATQNYSAALQQANTGLKLAPNSSELQKIKQEILNHQKSSPEIVPLSRN